MSTRDTLYRSERHAALSGDIAAAPPAKPEPQRSMWADEKEMRWLPWLYVAVVLGTALAWHFMARWRS